MKKPLHIRNMEEVDKYRTISREATSNYFKLLEDIRFYKIDEQEIFGLVVIGGSLNKNEFSSVYSPNKSPTSKLHLACLRDQWKDYDVVLKASILDVQKAIEVGFERALLNGKIGKEELEYATILELPSFKEGLKVPYDADYVVNLLRKDAPEFI